MYQPKPNVSFSAGQLAEVVAGQLVGDSSVKTSGICTLKEDKPGCISFTKETRADKVSKSLVTSQLACLIVNERLFESLKGRVAHSPALIGVRDPYASLLKLSHLFFDEIKSDVTISDRAAIHPTARIGERVSIGDFASIGADVEIGDDVVIHPHTVLYQGVKIGTRSVLHARVTVREFCEIGADCILHCGVVIGADGFGYLPSQTGVTKVPHVGIVRINDAVEIGANSCIDRGTFGETVVGRGSKIDNLVQIGHNVTIGQSSLVCGHTGIAGSCTIGNGVVIGGATGIADHCTIADRVRIGGKSGVIASITEPGDYVGYPAIPAQEWRRQGVALATVTKGLKQLRKLLRSTDEES
jgi:UDP-3-O-[3-hydroxymyristoyl] glucosamine N-acyltransferase